MKSTFAPFLLATALALAGCSGSSSNPAAPDGPLIFSGRFEAGSDSLHDLDMFDDGLLTVTLLKINVLLFDTTQGGSPANLALGFGLGQRDEDGECNLTTNILIREGENRVYRLSRDVYCLSVFDAGTLPEDALVGYELRVAITT